MTYLETLAKLNTYATGNPVQFRTLWEAACMAQVKVHNLTMAAKQLGVAMPAAEQHTSTPEERAIEDSLSVFLGDGKTPASGINYHQVLTWLETVDVGDAILGKIRAIKTPEPANA